MELGSEEGYEMVTDVLDQDTSFDRGGVGVRKDVVDEGVGSSLDENIFRPMLMKFSYSASPIDSFNSFTAA